MYIDDGFFIFRDTKREDIMGIISSLITWPNSLVHWEESSVKIASVHELSCGTHIDYLDCRISTMMIVGNNSTLGSPRYQFVTGLGLKKPLGSRHPYLHWRSCQPCSMKKSVVIGELVRRLRICSNETNYNVACRDLKQKLMAQEYPCTLIDALVNKYPFDRRDDLLQQVVTNIHHKRTTLKNPFTLTNSCYLQSHHVYSLPCGITPLVIRFDPRNQDKIRRACKIFRGDDVSNRIVIAYRNNHLRCISRVVVGKSQKVMEGGKKCVTVEEGD